jgi:hypothetical protein
MLSGGWFLAALFAFAVTARAHRLDEYLQAALVEVGTNGVNIQLSLTPGTGVADAVLALIDLNHDHQISGNEATAYAERVRSALALGLDGKPLNLQISEVQCPPYAELQSGLGTIQLKLLAPFAVLGAGAHVLKFENRHRRELSVYLVNALMPASPEIQITQQVRDTIQSESRIQFNYSPKDAVASKWFGVITFGVLIAGFAAVYWQSTRRA